MDRNINGAVIVINNHIADGQREDTAGPVAVRVLGESRVFVDRDSRQFLYYCREDLPAVSAAIEKAGSEGARFILTVGRGPGNFSNWGHRTGGHRPIS